MGVLNVSFLNNLPASPAGSVFSAVGQALILPHQWFPVRYSLYCQSGGYPGNNMANSMLEMDTAVL